MDGWWSAVCRYLQKPEEWVRSSGVGVTDSCESLDILSARDQTWVLWNIRKCS